MLLNQQALNICIVQQFILRQPQLFQRLLLCHEATFYSQTLICHLLAALVPYISANSATAYFLPHAPPLLLFKPVGADFGEALFSSQWPDHHWRFIDRRRCSQLLWYRMFLFPITGLISSEWFSFSTRTTAFCLIVLFLSFLSQNFLLWRCPRWDDSWTCGSLALILLLWWSFVSCWAQIVAFYGQIFRITCLWLRGDYLIVIHGVVTILKLIIRSNSFI